MSHEVFISYAQGDKNIADAVCARLEQDGTRCWYAPRDIVHGAPWNSSIIDAIAQARVMVLILSEASNRSAHVHNEVERAIHNELHLIPFRIEDVTPGKELELFLSRPHWLDAITPPIERHIDELARTVGVLREHLSAEESGAPVGRDEARAGTPDQSTAPGDTSSDAASAHRPRAVLLAALAVVAAVLAWSLLDGNGGTAPGPASTGAETTTHDVPSTSPSGDDPDDAGPGTSVGDGYPTDAEAPGSRPWGDRSSAQAAIPAVGDTPDAGGTGFDAAAATAALASLGESALRVRFERDGRKATIGEGMIGGRAVPAPQDRVMVRLRFDADLHVYLLSASPDSGEIRCVWPTKTYLAPEPRSRLDWPTEGQFYTPDDVGSHAFFLVASDEPLPAFDAWKARTPGLAWTPVNGDDPVSFDGEDFDVPGTDRGSLHTRDYLPEPFRELCLALRDQWPDLEIRAFLFQVAP